jgi:hypothetical protein
MADGKRGGDHAPEYKHVDDMEWEMGRLKNRTKFLFHPRADRPTEPNAGLIRYEPGASYPLHRHEFAQVGYVLEGELCCGGTTYGPGTFVYMPDPHFEDDDHEERMYSCVSSISGSDDRCASNLRRAYEPNETGVGE